MLTSLRILINALSSALLPVLNAFLLLTLVSSVFAVLATDLFGELDDMFMDFLSLLCVCACVCCVYMALLRKNRSLFLLDDMFMDFLSLLCVCACVCVCVYDSFM